jgi:hypothetical protein
LSYVHDVFHISQLKKCLRVPEEQLPKEELSVQGDLTYTEYPIKIIDTLTWVTRNKVLKKCKCNGVILENMKLLGKEKKSTVKTEWIVVAAANSLPDGEVDLGWSKWHGNSVRGQGGNAAESVGGSLIPRRGGLGQPFLKSRMAVEISVLAVAEVQDDTRVPTATACTR